MSTSTFLAVVAMLLCGGLSLLYSRFVRGRLWGEVFGALTVILVVLAAIISVVEAFG